MSEENVETLRRMYGSGSVEELAAFLHPDAELRQAREIPDADAYVGRAEFLRGLQLWLEEWEDFRFSPEEIADFGERTLMRVRLAGRSRASGVELQATAFHLWAFRDGKPWRCDVYFDQAAALEAAGLSE
jgi:ketosteroid isomerase-like protein